MSLVRTNITLPEEVLARVDEVAGPRGRSRYIADVVARQVRRDHARRVFSELAGALKGSTTWGTTDEEVLETIRRLRDDTERERRIWGAEAVDEIPAGHDRARRSRAGESRSGRRRGTAVQRAE
ncbi:MAG TPA: hypothetical protein VFK54_03260 [Candidatus Limnocylindrales bacterium]|nr:hypothetical protein [Candidatus Limnocylindrales bacterium]